MKYGYVLQPEVAIEKNPETGENWVVIRRRSADPVAPEVAPEPEGEAPLPLDDQVQPADPVQPETAAEPVAEPEEAVTQAPPRSRLAIMRRATAGLGDDSASGEEAAPAPEPVAEEPALVEDARRDETPTIPFDDDVLPREDEDLWAEALDHVEQTRLEEASDEPGVDPDPEVEPEPEVDAALDYADPVEDDLSPFELGTEHAVPAPIAAQERPSGDDLWHAIPRITLGARVDGKPARRGQPSLIEYFRADPIAKGFDLLRTRLVRTIRAYGWRRIAVVSPTSGCGATFTAVNLALSLARVPGSRTILMDLNQRTPGVAEALGARHPNRLDDFLLGETAVEDYLVRPSRTLAVGLADAPNALAAEVLHDPHTSDVLTAMMDSLDPDLVLYDMPPMLAHDDLAAFLPQVDGVLLVVDGTKTLPDHVAACERIIEGQTQLLGVVLNRGRTEGNPDLIA